MKNRPCSSTHEAKPGYSESIGYKTEGGSGLTGASTNQNQNQNQIAGATVAGFGCSFGEIGGLGCTEKCHGFVKLVKVAVADQMAAAALEGMPAAGLSSSLSRHIGSLN